MSRCETGFCQAGGTDLNDNTRDLFETDIVNFDVWAIFLIDIDIHSLFRNEYRISVISVSTHERYVFYLLRVPTSSGPDGIVAWGGRGAFPAVATLYPPTLFCESVTLSFQIRCAHRFGH